MKKILIIFTLIFILLNVLVCGAHALGVQTQSGIPTRLEIVDLRPTANLIPLLRKPKTYLRVSIYNSVMEYTYSFVCKYGDEASKAWFEMITLAMINQKEIVIIYDPDCETTFILCGDFNSSCNCAATAQPITAKTLLGVFLDF